MSASMARSAPTLGGLGLVAALLVGLAHTATAPVIELRRQEDLAANLSQVVPSSSYDNDLLAAGQTLTIGGESMQTYRASLKGETSAVAFETSVEGYAGPIALLLAVQPDGTLLGVRVLAHTETPGLGDGIEAAKSDWVLEFEGKSLGNPSEERWTVKKDGGDFDAFTGATITPRAVVHGVKRGLLTFREHRDTFLGDAP